ncbi:hypothetical protein CEXT_679241 [Caerostris extrusa]|uniref:Uncharacterized protein n=1 Tax=Caerostris extrusa TaxID=172846 RepID=A0AAV4NMG5_CAEEX|nr:hypothetical protein CEXT_679241 [Caerostris extrusa]
MLCSVKPFHLIEDIKLKDISSDVISKEYWKEQATNSRIFKNHKQMRLSNQILRSSHCGTGVAPGPGIGEGLPGKATPCVKTIPLCSAKI